MTDKTRARAEGQIEPINVLGAPLETCSCDPLTGFWRDGCCNTGPADRGNHTVCAVMTQRFLEFSFQRGNDLSTPRPEWGFPGLKAGDRWCLCLDRWIEAREAGVAPDLVLEATHMAALRKVSLSVLKGFAVAPADPAARPPRNDRLN